MSPDDTPRVDLTSQTILETVPVLIVGVTQSGIVMLFNRACERLTGRPRALIVGRHCADALLRPSGWEVLQGSLPPEDEPSVVGTCEIPMLRADGGENLIRWGITALKDSATGATVFVCTGTDITDTRRLEQQLLQAEKLSALGQLIAGVAHELNNPLTGVLGFAQVTCARGDCPPQIQQDLESIQTNAKRCKAIVDNLLRFARQQKPERVPVDVNEIIEATLALMAYHFRAGTIEVARELDGALPPVEGDRNELQQVFVNIAGNAVYAMKSAHGRGRLTVRTRCDGSRVRIEFADDGPGIPADKLTRVFDPFYTTKPVGEGTGLGLSVCFGIVTAHKGRIWVESPAGGGATFFIELPVGAGAPAPERPRTTDTQMLRLKQRVLAVDDEETIREVLNRILTTFGFRVTLATSGEEACRILESESIDIVVCDLRMPGLGGPGLYDWVTARDPALAKRMLFCTGDTVSREAREFLRRSKSRVVAKPFNVSQLAQALSEIQYEIVTDAKRT